MITKDELKKIDSKVDTTGFDLDFWEEYKQDVYLVVDENEKLKGRLNNASKLIRRYAWSEKGKDVNRVVISLTNEQWDELIRLLEDFNVD